MKVIILAGGTGKRLWPLSSETFPKQFLGFHGRESLLLQTVNRFSQDEVLVVTSQKHVRVAERQLGPSYGDAILVEPASRNTAPAICLSLKYLLEKAGASRDDFCMVCPSDHYFGCEEDLRRLLPTAKKAAATGAIVTFGITPTYPETGYGYIQTEEGESVFPVTRFVEKPDLEEAKELLKEGKCYWNAGIFVFQIGPFLTQLREHAPFLFQWFLQPYKQALKSFPSLSSISIDHALMEKTSHILLIPYPSLWSDLGAWDRLAKILPRDENNNFLSGDVQAVDTNECMIFGDGIKTLGVKDLLIVKIGDQIVVCHRDEMHRLSELQKTRSFEKTDSY
jgi:mannose-1-phosphate guanylyltransferase / mannose-6-phosphate isomerase